MGVVLKECSNDRMWSTKFQSTMVGTALGGGFWSAAARTLVGQLGSPLN